MIRQFQFYTIAEVDAVECEEAFDTVAEAVAAGHRKQDENPEIDYRVFRVCAYYNAPDPVFSVAEFNALPEGSRIGADEADRILRAEATDNATHEAQERQKMLDAIQDWNSQE
jgi:hypothetical protein